MASLSHSFMALVARLDRQDFVNCTVISAACPIDSSYYFYRPSLAANAVFAAIFGISLISFIVTYNVTRRAGAFTIAVCFGTIVEIIGYIGRLMSWHNPWNQGAFLMQVVSLTIAPAFLAAGIYLLLKRVVISFGPENSRLKPETYPQLFIPCDILSLVLQAVGGGLASSATHQNKSPNLGENIMIAGLAFQVFTLLIFIILSLDFALRTLRRHRALGDAALDQNPAFVTLRQSWKFRGFLVALSLATITIFWRSTYRVAELSEGWTGQLVRKQGQFIGFEGVMVATACLALNFFHPALTFRDAFSEQSSGIGNKNHEKGGDRVSGRR